MSDTSEPKTYAGACHCKKVRFNVTMAIDSPSECNCSICSRVGWTMKSVAPSQFELLAGGDEQTDYQFGGRSMHHLFCKTCGVHAYGTFTHDGTEKVIVNLRCLDGVDTSKLKVEMFDGKSY